MFKMDRVHPLCSMNGKYTVYIFWETQPFILATLSRNKIHQGENVDPIEALDKRLGVIRKDSGANNIEISECHYNKGCGIIKSRDLPLENMIVC